MQSFTIERTPTATLPISSERPGQQEAMQRHGLFKAPRKPNPCPPTGCITGAAETAIMGAEAVALGRWELLGWPSWDAEYAGGSSIFQ